MSGPPAEPGPRTRAFVDFTLRYGRWIWLVALLLAIPATWRTAGLYLDLKSDLEELLPRHSPSVQAADELRARLPGLQYLGVVVDTGEASRLPAGERFIDDLAARIRTYPPDLVRAVRTSSVEERTFLEKHAALYVDADDLRSIRARIEARRDWEVAHETGAALDDDTAAPPLDFSDIEKKYEGKIPRRGESDGDRYSSKDLHLTMLLVEVGAFESGTARAKALTSRVERDIKALGGTAAYAPGMRRGYSGDIAISVEELDALVNDLAVSTVIVLVAVVAVIILYYRWSRSVIVLVPTLLLATVYAFAVASLPPFDVTALNSNTAFLGAIIVGNGINFGIVLLARYVEERRHGKGTRDALVVAVASARVGTLSAALGAGVAYASLVSTTFRGFRQFGIIGGIGMVMSWAMAFIAMPPLIAWVDRGRGAVFTQRRQSSFTGIVGRVVTRRPVAVLTIGLVLTGLALVEVSRFDTSALESDVAKLRRRDTWTRGEGYWGRRMDRLLGAYLTPTVMLTDSTEQAEAVAARLRYEVTEGDLGEMVSKIRTLEDVLPRDQAEKIAEASAIREEMTPKLRSLLAPERRADLERLLGDEDPKPVALHDLPRTLLIGLVERDGTAGKTVLVFPRPSKALWEGAPLVAFVDRLRAAGTVAGPRPARVAGSLPLSADILGSIQRDGAVTSALAFFGVLAVVVLMLRRHSTTLYVIGSLTVGVLWLVAATMVLGVKINFANFIAFPITFGIGVDYSVNVMSRYVQDGRRDVLGTIRATGSAVALCSLTTIIGYSSLLVAENRALFLFGVVAVLGELATLTTALTLLPAVLVLVDNRAHIGGRGVDTFAVTGSGPPSTRPPSAST
ncbi:MAG: exporters of the superfamily [Myxococcaceae bacterium]|nr:exporters of the superfamily [Myxococcaceae bacterium]